MLSGGLLHTLFPLFLLVGVAGDEELLYDYRC